MVVDDGSGCWYWMMVVDDGVDDGRDDGTQLEDLSPTRCPLAS